MPPDELRRIHARMEEAISEARAIERLCLPPEQESEAFPAAQELSRQIVDLERRLEESAESSRNEREAWAREKSAWESRARDLEAAREAAKASEKELEERLQKALASLGASMKDPLQAELRDARNRFEGLQAAFDKKQAAWASERAALEASLLKAADEAGRQHSEIQQLEQVKAALSAEPRTLKARLAEFERWSRQAHQAMRDRIAAEKARSEKERKRLDGELSQARDDARSVEAELDSCRIRLAALDKVRQGLNDELAAAREAEKASEKGLEDRGLTLRETEYAVRELQSRLKTMARELEAKDRELEAKDRELAEPAERPAAPDPLPAPSEGTDEDGLPGEAFRPPEPGNAPPVLLPSFEPSLDEPAWSRVARLFQGPAARAMVHLRRLAAGRLPKGHLALLRLAAGELAQAQNEMRLLERLFDDAPLSLKRGKLEPVVERALAAWAPAFRARGITVQHRPSILPDAAFHADALRLALFQILRNALEALPRGGTIVVESSHEPESGDIVVRFSDSGPGFSKAALADPFKPFSSGKPGRMGIGLAVVRRVLRSMGGEAEAGNGPKGAFMLLRLPPPNGPALPPL